MRAIACPLASSIATARSCPARAAAKPCSTLRSRRCRNGRATVPAPPWSCPTRSIMSMLGVPRSPGPSLRSGFLAGDRRLIRRVTQLVNFGGVAPSFPALAASSALWREESHVAGFRERYRQCFDIAQTLIGQRFGFYNPRGGFFLWLDVGDGESAARRLWAEA